MNTKKTLALKFQRSLLAPFCRRWSRSTQRHFTVNKNESSNLKLDVVIPLVPKDLPVFHYCLEGLKNNLFHPIRNFYIVAPDQPEIRKACEKSETQFIDEREVLPEGPEFYREIFARTPWQRGNWIYQQFLKLSVGEKLNLDNYLVYDSDTVLIKPFKYEFKGRTVLEYSDGYRSELDPFHDNLFPDLRLSPYSFMCHAMLMQTNMVLRLLNLIEERHGLPWKEGLLKVMDTDVKLCFSEYELYGNFALNTKLNGLTAPLKVYWYNNSMKRRDIDDFEEVVSRCQDSARTISFHSYAR